MDGTNQIAEYTYNGAGQRIKKATQSETRIFHCDLKGHLIAETNQTGQMIAEYVYLGDQLLSMIKPGNLVFYFHKDHLGTPSVLTDENQAIAWKATYTPFGQAAISVETIENPFRFPGQYYDSETGLHYNYFRYYDPTTGRYITPDPIGLEGGINLFFYVQNNPIRFTDHYGLADTHDEVFPPSPAFAESVRDVQEYAVLAHREAAEEYNSCKKGCDDYIDSFGCELDELTTFLLKQKCKADCLTDYLKTSMLIRYEIWKRVFGSYLLYQDKYGGGKEKDYRGTHRNQKKGYMK